MPREGESGRASWRRRRRRERAVGSTSVSWVVEAEKPEAKSWGKSPRLNGVDH